MHTLYAFHVSILIQLKAMVYDAFSNIIVLGW